MRIVIDSCAYTHRNVGDLAMLTVAVSRLRELWPAAEIKVITSAPEVLARHCGKVQPIALEGRRQLLHDRLLGRLEKQLPAHVAARCRAVETRLRLRYPAVLAISLGVKRLIDGRNTTGAAEFVKAITDADLVVVSGAGAITDAFVENAVGVLATLDMALTRHIPAAMFGQGFGPIVGEELRALTAAVLPRVRLIGLRERRASVPLLRSFGVPEDHIVVTGDDAIELALPPASPHASGLAPESRAIGVNVRVAHYSDVTPRQLAILRATLRAAAAGRAAELVPLPIAHRAGFDVEVLRELLAGLCADDSGGAALDTPSRVIDRIHQCRLVVTGSYHAAVFALAQGIPAVCLAASQYYRDKMSGLAEQFPEACPVVMLDDEASLMSRLEVAIEWAWDNAARVRPALIARAADQVARGREAYARLPAMVG